MKRLALIIALIFVGMYLNAQEENCVQMTEGFKSEKEAIEHVQKATFKTHDSILPDASWMKIAQFYSCDDEFGYLIVKSEKKEFIHQNVPKAVWLGLKEARSIGGYYNFYIKNKYKLEKKNSAVPVL